MNWWPLSRYGVERPPADLALTFKPNGRILAGDPSTGGAYKGNIFFRTSRSDSAEPHTAAATE